MPPRERTSTDHVTIGDAEKFLNMVKTTVSPEEYRIFMSLILETKDERTDIEIVLTKVMELFRLHGELLGEFNWFLARVYKIVPLKMPGRFQIRRSVLSTSCKRQNSRRLWMKRVIER
ncbi:hypothetical protein RHMOL_Rhmol03G0193800 [Rhododendron molle]|uniref:Uncharacterized protein n=1 Tax=Rhododendron molle TaxID=49168 RepID=A0ACC0PJC8_RHOML|nr:hypothetical protein RHMOL_Rhmol03G0193800 [Rhododendron molle]